MHTSARDPSATFSLIQSKSHSPHAIHDTRITQHLLSTTYLFCSVHHALLDSPQMSLSLSWEGGLLTSLPNTFYCPPTFTLFNIIFPLLLV